MHHKLKQYDEKIKQIEQQINDERQLYNDCIKRLEDPSQKGRKRNYSGKDLSLKELKQKVTFYEERCNDKNQQVWEKKVILNQLEEKIAKLQTTIDKDQSTRRKKMRKVGNVKNDIIKQRRQKMAALSEMAIYMAEAEEIKEETLSTRQFREEATARTARGESFDEYAEKVIRMHERDIHSARTPKRRNDLFEFDEDSDEEKPKGREKYDAYPTADGLSRPYGGFPVFQPAPPSGNLRYFKKEPTQRPIQL